jgi:MFS family permease
MGGWKVFKEYKILLNRNCLLLLGANLCYSLADIAFDFFLSWYVYSLTGNIINLVAMLSSSVFFKAVLSLFTGAVTDLVNKKRLLIFSSMGSTPIILSSLLVLRYFPTTVWLYVAIILLNDIFNVLFSKALTTISAELFDEKTYISFKAIASVLNQSVYVMGQAAMGFLLMYAKDVTIISFIILSLVFTAFLLSILRYQNVKQIAMPYLSKENISFKTKTGIYLNNILNTAKTKVFNDSYYRSFCLVIFTLNLVYGFLSSVLPYSLSNVQEISSAYVGLVKAALSIGGIIGMLLVPKIVKRVTGSFITGLIGSLVSIFFIFLFKNNSALIGIFFFSYGFFDSITQPLYSYTIKRIDDSVRGSIIGVIDFIILLASPIGMFICGILANKKSIFVEVFVIFIFLSALLIVKKSKDLNNIYIE